MTRVLIVDDEPDVLKMLKMVLELEGYETLLASDGQTALRRIELEEPDLVLLDIMMPVLDGWGVLEKLQKASLRKLPKVIILTAKGERSMERAMELGASRYLSKPFETEDLLASVRDVLHH